jgi:HK97 family phage major capsid protein
MEISFKKALGIAAGLGFTGSAYAELTKFLSDRSESARIAGNIVALKALQVSQPDANTVTVIEVPDEGEAPAAPAQESMAKGLAFDADRFQNAVMAKVDAVLKARGEVQGRPNVMPEVTGGMTVAEKLYEDERAAGIHKAFKTAHEAEAFGSMVLKNSGILPLIKGQLGEHYNRLNADIARVEKNFRPNVRKDYTTGPGSVDGLTGVQFVPDVIRLVNEFGVASKICNVINGVEQSIVRTRAATETQTVSYPTEGGTSAVTDQTFLTERLTPKMLSAVSAASIAAIKWSRIDLGNEIALGFARSFARREDQNMIQGDGTSASGGMIGVGPQFTTTGNQGLTFATARGTIAGGAGWANITAANFQAALGRIPAYARMGGNCRWLCSYSFYETVMCPIMRAGGGNTANDLSTFGSNEPRFYSLPVTFSEVMPQATAATTLTGAGQGTNVPVFVGDFNMGVDVARGSDFNIESDTSVGFANGLIYFRGILFHDVNTNHACGTATVAGPVVSITNT